MKPWTTDFDPAPTRHDCKKSVIDWARVRKATEPSPYAQAFLVLLEKLDVIHEGDS